MAVNPSACLALFKLADYSKTVLCSWYDLYFDTLLTLRLFTTPPRLKR
jgi:hypothetical protein